MEDDLDELLDEVERKFCSKVSVSAVGRGGTGDGKKHENKAKDKETKGSTKCKLLGNSDGDDLDAFLDQLLEEDCDDFTPTKTSSRGAAVEKKPSSQSGTKKCGLVFIGGTSVPNGIGTATSKRSCDQLRCTSCDFRVLTFDDSEWDSSCDYLFFRNNMPEQEKLESKLKRRRGSRSYSCQCSWISVCELTELTLTPQLRWVCAGKHQ